MGEISEGKNVTPRRGVSGGPVSFDVDLGVPSCTCGVPLCTGWLLDVDPVESNREDQEGIECLAVGRSTYHS